MYEKQIDAYFADKEPQMIDLISRLARIRSVREDPQRGMPFGAGPYLCLEEALRIARELGFSTQNHEGYVGTVDLNREPTKLHILGHLDVVGEGKGWTVTEPYTPKLVDGMLYGRGTDDDKGPMVAALLAMKAVQDLNLPLSHNVRLILGTDEESGSEDIAYYYQNNPYADYTFSPDADFPLINIEKGSYKPRFVQTWQPSEVTPRLSSLQGGFRINVVPPEADAVLIGLTPPELTPYLAKAQQDTGVLFTAELRPDGKTALHAAGQGGHAAFPEGANNALTALLALLAALPLGNCPSTAGLRALHILFPHGDTRGEALGIDQQDEVSGPLTLAFTLLAVNELGFSAQFDSRVPLCATPENCQKVTEAAFKAYSISCSGEMGAPHHTPADSPLVQTLLDCYEEYTGKTGSKPLAIGGGTYVHDIPGGV
ncbi:MAG: Sapep family Mn(2+)-dependent dipeptidase, partial [Oscillospiraceae bacterium]